MVSITSTQSLTNALRRSVLDVQTQLSKTQAEVSTGRLADIGLGLGAAIQQDYSYGFHADDLAALTASNNVITTRLSATDTALSSIASTAQNFLQTLVSAQSGAGSDPGAIKGYAETGLKSLISALDTSVDGVQIFGGVNTAVAPLADYFSTTPSTAKQSVDQAFFGAFGVAQGDAGASAITDQQMATFLSGSFADLFSSSGWSSNWSSATDETATNRISLSQTSETSVSANETSLRQLAQAYTMVADLGVESLSSSAYQQILKTASATMSDAISGLTNLRATVGVMQKGVSDANESLSAQSDMIKTQIGSLENVDPYEASTRLNNLTTQLETSYTLTGKIQQLTLSKYI
ncbi:flagellar hook-associated 3 family protein [Methylosinus sp. R-45379]|jgi:flagellar hook-associated protein 3 FlgL|uniref:flagellar hook-associated family protein n=1 Tax=unclassified Methylosinus TaxID=2624500 RepID=UPI0004654F1F|nr:MULTISPECIES: flagellar hook-associated family protein [unclassified Methylosinus]OAI29605.1 flagellar hook-associated 3 family protein [Methylosinus sp. R-45379]TDX65855.1 flagellar hook-associated protein 3 FlgL [Methylosinus sp. sav-2]